MIDILVEIFRTTIVGGIVFFLLVNRNNEQLKMIKGWNYMKDKNISV
jgi:hypothetical protein